MWEVRSKHFFKKISDKNLQIVWKLIGCFNFLSLFCSLSSFLLRLHSHFSDCISINSMQTMLKNRFPCRLIKTWINRVHSSSTDSNLVLIFCTIVCFPHQHLIVGTSNKHAYSCFSRIESRANQFQCIWQQQKTVLIRTRDKYNQTRKVYTGRPTDDDKCAEKAKKPKKPKQKLDGKIQTNRRERWKKGKATEKEQESEREKKYKTLTWSSYLVISHCLLRRKIERRKRHMHSKQQPKSRIFLDQLSAVAKEMRTAVLFHGLLYACPFSPVAIYIYIYMWLRL